MPTREKGFAICLENRGAEDLDIRKVYRVLHDKDAAATGYVRVIDESGEDYLYRAWMPALILPVRWAGGGRCPRHSQRRGARQR